jgi:hypothetical protein
MEGHITTFLDDGSVMIQYQTEIGWVSSAHLVIPKALQLRAAYNRKHNLPIDHNSPCPLD